MPTRVGPHTQGNGGLVFAFDTGDTVNSYKGEPTENLVDAFPDTSLPSGFHLTYEFSASIQDTPVSDHEFSDKKWVKFTKTSATNGRVMFTNGSFTSGSQYTWSCYVYCNDSRLTSLYHGSDNVTYSQRTSFKEYDFNKLGTVQRLYGTWNQLQNAGSVFGMRAGSTNPVSSSFYMTGLQVEEKGHMTPVIDGERSATQGLIDLTGNSTIDLTNVSFDSNAQITFDGSNDYVDLGSPSTLDLSTVTQEVVYQPLGINRRNPLIGDNNPTGSDSAHAMWLEHYTNNKLLLVFGDGSTYGDVFSTATITDTTKYHHVVCVRNAATKTVEYFINGVSDGVKDWANKSTIGTPIVYDGSFNNNNYNHWIGGSLFSKSYSNIPYVKIYNRALTAEEVKANYNAIKGRFNI